MPFINRASAASQREKSKPDTNNSSSSAGLPVAGAELWFDGTSLSSLSDGSSVTLWTNKGSLGSSFNLVNTNGLGNNAGTTAGPQKQTQGGKPCVYFNGSSNWVLWFKTFHDSQSPNGAYYFDGNSSGGTSPNARTIFYVYKTPGGNISAFGTYAGNYSPAGYGCSYDNVGYAYSTYYVIVESNDGFPLSSTNSLPQRTDNSIQQAGHKQDTGSTVYAWSGRTGGLVNISYSNTTSAQVHPTGIGYSRGSTVNNGYIFEIIVYPSYLSDSEIQTVRNYLGQKYGESANG